MEDGILADMGEGRSGDETPHQGDSPKRLNNHDRKVEYAANFKLWRAEVKRVRRRAEREAKFIDTVLPFAIRVEERVSQDFLFSSNFWFNTGFLISGKTFLSPIPSLPRSAKPRPQT